MKKTIIKVLSAVLSLLFIVGCFGVYHFYGDEIVETINGWLQIDKEQQNTNYNKLQSLIVQMDSNNSEIVELEKKIEENQLLIEEKLLIADAENLAEIEKLKAVNEVFKNRVIELEKENQILKTKIADIQSQINELQGQIDNVLQRYQTYGTLNTSGVTTTGFVEYIRLGNKKGILNISLYVPENTNGDNFAVCDFNILSNLLGISFNYTTRYVTGTWVCLDKPDVSGTYIFGQACAVHEEGFIVVGRYYSPNQNELGWWPQNILSGHVITLTNLCVEEI